MHDISCPNCGKAFKIDETGYADILKQIRDHAFEAQLTERLALAEKEKYDALELVKSEMLREAQIISATKASELQSMQAQLDAAEAAKTAAVNAALNNVQRERDAALHELDAVKRDKDNALKLAELNQSRALQEANGQKEQEIQALKSVIDSHATEKQLAVTQAIRDIEKKRNELSNQLERATL